MADTLIEWADQVANVIKVKGGGYHCTKVSEGCEHCYAEVFNRRFGNKKPFDATPTEFVLDEKLFEKLARARKPKRVFLQSMGDLFHEDVPDILQVKVIEWVSKLPQHTFMILTKRPERMDAWDYRSACWPGQKIDNWAPLPNLWLLVSAENQARLIERASVLLQIPAAVHGVSYEPALGPLDITQTPGIDLLIAGGETGPGARPAHPDWFRKVRDDCKDAGAAFYLKSWGDWAPFHDVTDFEARKMLVALDGNTSQEYCGWGRDNPTKQYVEMVRVGKRRAGRLLDGVEHNELPKVGARA